MKNLKLLLFSLIAFAFVSQAQVPQYYPQWGMQTKRFIPDSLQGLPTDTFRVHSSLQNIPFIANKAGSIYNWNISTHVWDLFSSGEVTQSALDDTAAAIRGDFPAAYTDAQARAALSLTTTGTSGVATYNSGTGVFNIPNYTGGLSEIIAGYGLQNVNDSTIDVDSLVIANRDWVMDRIDEIDQSTVLFDSLGTDAGGISPVTTSNNILYARRMYVTGGGYFDTTVSGGLRLNLIPVSQYARLQVVASLASATTNVVIMGNRIWAINSDSTFWYSYSVTDSVSTAVSYDADAENYMTRVESAGRTLTLSEKSAINDYVITLKDEGIWAIIYDRGLPIWGSSAPSLETLKDVSSPTAVASPSFTSSGVEFNGTTQYLTTGIAPSTSVSLTSAHISYYSQDDVTETSIDIGVSSGTNRLHLLSKITTTGTIGRMFNTSTGQVSSTTPASTAGYFMVSRTSGTDLRLFYNGAQVGSTVNTTGGSLPTHGIYIGAENASGTASTFSTRKCSMWSIGAGLTVSEALADKNATETLMDALGIGVIP